MQYEYHFENADAGLELFKQYIAASPKDVIQLLVDFSDEEFNKETVPSVSIFEKKALLDRLLKRRYRDFKYHHAHFLERVKDQRKEDVYTVIGAHQDPLLDKWITLLHEQEVPMAGLWTTSLISGHYAKHLNLKYQKLIVSILHSDYSIRDVFIDQGHITLARKTRLNYTGGDLAETYALHLSSQADSLRRHLANKSLLGFTETLHVACILPKSISEQAQAMLVDKELIDFKVIDQETILKKINLSGVSTGVDAAINSYFCSRENLNTTHYDNEMDQAYKKHANIQTMSQVFFYGSILAFAMSALLVIQIRYDTLRMGHLQRVNNKIVSLTDERFGEMEAILNDANTVKASISHAQTILEKSAVSPLSFLAFFGNLFSQPQYSAMKLNDFDWLLASSDKVNEIITSDPTVENPEPLELESGVYPVMTISGRLIGDDINYRKASIIVDNFVSDIQQTKGVLKIKVLKKPYDVGKDVKFSDSVGDAKGSVSENKSNLDYQMMLFMDKQR